MKPKGRIVASWFFFIFLYFAIIFLIPFWGDYIEADTTGPCSGFFCIGMPTRWGSFVVIFKFGLALFFGILFARVSGEEKLSKKIYLAIFFLFSAFLLMSLIRQQVVSIKNKSFRDFDQKINYVGLQIKPSVASSSYKFADLNNDGEIESLVLHSKVYNLPPGDYQASYLIKFEGSNYRQLSGGSFSVGKGDKKDNLSTEIPLTRIADIYNYLFKEEHVAGTGDVAVDFAVHFSRKISIPRNIKILEVLCRDALFGCGRTQGVSSGLGGDYYDPSSKMSSDILVSTGGNDQHAPFIVASANIPRSYIPRIYSPVVFGRFIGESPDVGAGGKYKSISISAEINSNIEGRAKIYTSNKNLSGNFLGYSDSWEIELEKGTNTITIPINASVFEKNNWGPIKFAITNVILSIPERLCVDPFDYSFGGGCQELFEGVEYTTKEYPASSFE